MDYEHARQKLMIHGSFVANSDEWAESFLGLLKPYRKRIGDEVFEDIIECLKVAYPYVNTSQTVDAQVVTGVQGILHYGRNWVLDPESGLRKSGRISDDEVDRIAGWLNVISDIYTHMLWMKSDEHYVFGEFLASKLTGRSSGNRQ